MNKKIIFFDVDGTLYNHEKGMISQNVKDAIKKTREQGHLCFIASGRPAGYIAENVKEIGFDGYVLANGAHIQYQDKNLEVRYLNEDYLKKLVQNLKSKNIEYVLETPTYCYIEKRQKNLLNFYTKCNIDFCHLCFEYDENEIIDKVIKIEVWVKDKKELQYVKSCFHSFAYELHPDQHSIEVYAKDVSKATGILDVLRLLDIPIEDSYCFGDGPNDIEMFETVGHAIAMGNAIDILKEKADDICLSVQEDGVAYKLKELFNLK